MKITNYFELNKAKRVLAKLVKKYRKTEQDDKAIVEITEAIKKYEKTI